jgi:hypothetical protein
VVLSTIVGGAIAWGQPVPTAPSQDSPSDPPLAAPIRPVTAADSSSGLAPPGVSVQQLTSLKTRIAELENRLDDVERSTGLQRLQWTADYRSSLASYWYHGASPDSNPYAAPTIVNLRNREQWLHRVRLGIKAQPNKSFRFRGRLSVFKRFGSNVSTPSPQDFSQGRVPSDSTLRMDRFWLDWFITPKVALSVGRISYSDGSPAELREYLTAPDATWGLTMVDGEYETVDLTVQALPQVLVRGFYAAWAFPRNDDLFSSSLFLNSGTENLRIIGGNADVTLAEGKFFSQLGFYAVPRFRPFAIPLPSPAFYSDPNANPNNAPPPLDGSLVFPSRLPSSLGSYANASLFIMARDIHGLDLFAGGSLGWLAPNDQAIWYRGFAPDGSEQPVLTLVGADTGLWNIERNAQGQPLIDPATQRPRGTFDTRKAASKLTHFGYLGARWRLPIADFPAPLIGLEYNRASRYHISFAQSTDLLTNKLAVRGSAWEAYVLQPVTERAFLRIDWTLIDAQYTSGTPGNIAGASGFFGSPDNPMSSASAHGGTSPSVAPGGQYLHALSATLHVSL